MNRSHGVILTIAVALATSACASSAGSGGEVVVTPTPAQGDYPPGLAQPSDNEVTARAGLLLAQIAGTADEAIQRQRGQEALAIIETGLQQDPMNPKLWLMKGQAAVAADQYVVADSAFGRALEIYPAYEPQIEAEREAAWIAAFNSGVREMNAGDRQAALASLEMAGLIYDRRPEAQLNLASLYLSEDRPEDAIAAYEAALATMDSPAAADLPAEIKADWPGFRELARANIAQIYASMGVEHFRSEEYEESAEDFSAALEINPYYRDALHNLAQSLYMRTTALEEDSAPVSDAVLVEAYERFKDVAEQVREIDPFNQNTNLFLARAYRGLGQHAETEAERDRWQREALRVLQENEALPFQITNVQVQLNDSTVEITGDLENLNMEQGEQVTLRFSMLAADGSVAGAEDVTVVTPAREQATDFSVLVPVAEPALGWKYERVGI
ncbi:MAG: hypothetical protein ACRELV_16175 [Longimicrobiales bacterium]